MQPTGGRSSHPSHSSTTRIPPSLYGRAIWVFSVSCKIEINLPRGLRLCLGPYISPLLHKTHPKHGSRKLPIEPAQSPRKMSQRHTHRGQTWIPHTSCRDAHVKPCGTGTTRKKTKHTKHELYAPGDMGRRVDRVMKGSVAQLSLPISLHIKRALVEFFAAFFLLLYRICL